MLSSLADTVMCMGIIPGLGIGRLSRGMSEVLTGVCSGGGEQVKDDSSKRATNNLFSETRSIVGLWTL
jgi:hypothetical protein